MKFFGFSLHPASQIGPEEQFCRTRYTDHYEQERYVKTYAGQEVRHGVQDENGIFEQRKVQHVLDGVLRVRGTAHAV